MKGVKIIRKVIVQECTLTQIALKMSRKKNRIEIYRIGIINVVRSMKLSGAFSDDKHFDTKTRLDV